MGFGRFEVGPDDYEGPAGRSSTSGVIIYPNGGTAAEIEKTLVHEFEHYVQPDSLSLPPESIHLQHPIQEGAATYVEVVYAERYLPSLDPVADRKSSYVDATRNSVKLGASHYYFGYQYVAQRIDSPKDLSQVYDDPPWSSGQLLHGHDWDASRPLRVDVGDSWTKAVRPAGEHFLRVMLATELNESAAASAATGWANDTVVGSNSESGNVWVIRMTDERNASELRVALERYFGARATPTDEGWRTGGTIYRLVRVDETTVAIVAGGADFVDAVTVSKDGGTIAVTSEAESRR
ncbi:hypothetical protein BRC81_05580 [Halobacteriales archaeon QS_1_68_20]|nr:MAG: hypothetical protein BRC81_05580 [Halobacteriales archaeon QS_1_68_20]